MVKHLKINGIQGLQLESSRLRTFFGRWTGGLLFDPAKASMRPICPFSRTPQGVRHSLSGTSSTSPQTPI